MQEKAIICGRLCEFPITEDGKAVERREWEIKEERGETGKMREEVEEKRGALLLAGQFP